MSSAKDGANAYYVFKIYLLLPCVMDRFGLLRLRAEHFVENYQITAGDQAL